jgi:mono/diheme cytochrome c family protein
MKPQIYAYDNVRVPHSGVSVSTRMSGKQIVRRARSLGFVMAAAFLGGCKQLPPPTPLNQLNAQQMRGYYVFQSTCRQCHSDRVSQPLNGPSLRGVFKKQYLPSGAPANDDRVMATVVNGYGIMPAMGRSLSQQDLNDLLAYLHTL